METEFPAENTALHSSHVHGCGYREQRDKVLINKPAINETENYEYYSVRMQKPR